MRDRKKSGSPIVGRGLPRIIEIAVASTVLIILAPVAALAAVAIALTSRGPVLFKQRRVGQAGRTFSLYKLRTMVASCSGPQVTAADDIRVTRVGSWLRKVKLDEVPQLWNVIRGDMSLVGPRPEVPQYVDLGSESWSFVLQAKPGVTDPVTIRLRNEEQLLMQMNGNREEFYLKTLQPYKLTGYQKYLQRRNWVTDLVVLAETLLAVLMPGKYSPPSIEDILASKNTEPELRKTKVEPRHSLRLLRFWSRLRFSRLFIRQTQFSLDVLALAGSFWFAYLLRFDFAIPREELGGALLQICFVVPLQFLVLMGTGVYSFIWRYIGMAEVRTFLKSAFLTALPLILIRLMLPAFFKPVQIPLSITVMATVFGFGSVLGLRVARRALHEALMKRKGLPTGDIGPKKRVLLIGAGRAGVIAAREIIDVGNSNLEIRGFVDDDPNKHGSVIQSIKVLGSTSDLPRLVSQHNIHHIVISIAKATRQDFRRILDICESIPIKVRVIPGIYELLQGKVKVSRIRDLQIEDLLGREPVQLEEEEVRRFLAGKTVMVTGAGGSIGSELARQVARLRPANLLLVERAEFALFDIDKDLEMKFSAVPRVPLVADICDDLRMREIFRNYRPDVVFHAAAHKHVPMMECNPVEAVKNNVLATRLLGDLAGEFGVEVFVMVSTDKAVRPTSVMGASKRVAELVVQDLDKKYDTRYVAVRFGNVIGSAGSVIPIFREQILNGGPLTVTHPEMTRYFMTIPEAAQLVLQAGAIGEGGEIFILDMGEPVRILDLAEEAISLSGLRPYEDIGIVFTGMRPGEKLFEELQMGEEQVSKTRHPKILIGKIAAYQPAKVTLGLNKLELLARRADERELRRFFNSFLPEARIDVNVPEKAKTATADEARRLA